MDLLMYALIKKNSSDASTIISRIDSIEQAGYQTENQVSEKIANAIQNITSFKTQRVLELPQVGEEATIYFVPTEDAEEQNLYDEFLYIDDNWEQVGTTKIELPTDISDLTDDNNIIPTDISQLSDEQGIYATQTYVNEQINNLQATIEIVRLNEE